MNPSRYLSRKTFAGFSLTEVLVSIFVLSLGAMTTVGMQTTALAASRQSEYQATALRLASELADVMRDHSAFMRVDRFKDVFLQIDYPGKTNQDSGISPKTCYVQDDECSNEEFLRFEIDAIKSQLTNSLPGGRIKVCRDELPEGGDVRHHWSCAEGEQMPVVIKLGWNGKQHDGHSAQEKREDFPQVVLTVFSYLN